MITELLDDLRENVKQAFSTTVEMIDVDEVPAVDDMYIEVPKWHRIEDVVCVVADLKGSTKLGFSQYANTSAKLYEGLTSNMVRTVSSFAPAFVAIQGDGLFALFDGHRRYERGLAAGVTLKTFSEKVLVDEIEKSASFSERFPDTGLKVGMHASLVVVKKVGVRGANEPVWAGKLVNWATKAAQHAEAHELVATQRVYNHFKDNKLVTHTCGCPDGIKKPLWRQTNVEALPDTDSQCLVLESKWCEMHGDDYCTWILEGLKDEPEGEL
jgi:class 3 adenylate cyclase